MENEDAILSRFLAVRDHLDERGLRMFAAAEARAIGHGGILLVSRVTGIARSTIGRGLNDLKDPTSLTGIVRREGAGRPSLISACPSLLDDLRILVEPAIMGDPMRPLLWVSKSRVKLAASLVAMGHKVSPNTVANLLDELDFRRQVNRKTREGGKHPDRNEQFEYINEEALSFQAQGQPVISVDTKKKENLGDFKNGGNDYRPKGCPDEVRTHDFIDKDLGKAAPYGIYDICANSGWVTVGIDNENNISITVSHYPPGTSKWNKIEHRLFCHITQNWRGKPLTSRLAVIELIASTTTTTGLTVRCELDTRSYAKAIKVSDEEFGSLNIQWSPFHPDWNYTIHPRTNANTQHEALIIE